MIERGKGQRTEWVFRRPVEMMEKWAVQRKANFSHVKKMFWAGLAWDRHTELVVMKGDPESKRGGVTAKAYTAVLQEHLPTILRPDSIFIHDNARPHTAKKTQKWLRENNVELMEWPPYSPDLNPIENV
jgi:hypothetical protein